MLAKRRKKQVLTALKGFSDSRAALRAKGEKLRKKTATRILRNSLKTMIEKKNKIDLMRKNYNTILLRKKNKFLSLWAEAFNMKSKTSLKISK